MHRFQAAVAAVFVVAVVGCGIWLVIHGPGSSLPVHVPSTQDGLELTLSVPRRASLRGTLAFTAVVTNRSARTVGVSDASWAVSTDRGIAARRGGAIKYMAPSRAVERTYHVTLASGESTTFAGRIDLKSVGPLSRRHPAVYPSTLTVWARFGGLRDTREEFRGLGIGSGDRTVLLD